MITLREWFSMKDGRSSFSPRLPEDARLVFCHGHLIQDDIVASIERAFATDNPIKMLLWGDWGVGKTHLIYHIKWWLENNEADFPATPVVIEIGDITKKSRFDEIVRPFLDRMGLNEIIELVHSYRGIEPNVAQGLRNAGVSGQIADAFNKILLSTPGQAPVELVVLTFEHLKGRKVSGGGSGLGQPLEQSEDFYNVLNAIGVMHLRVKGRRLVFVADEAARLDNVSADEASNAHWLNANKLIYDDRNRSFGFIYTVSGKQPKHIPQAIWDPQIQNRLGQNVFRLDTLATKDVEAYLDQVVKEFVDFKKVSVLVGSGEINVGEYVEAAYPFTVAGRARFVDYFNRSQENAKPRDISKRLDEVAFLATKLKTRLVTEDCVQRQNM
jgi:hypothetical protein